MYTYGVEASGPQIAFPANRGKDYQQASDTPAPRFSCPGPIPVCWLFSFRSGVQYALECVLWLPILVCEPIYFDD